METETETRAMLVRVPEWAHRTFRVAAAHGGTSMQSIIQPSLLELARSLGGDPSCGANPSPALSGQPPAGQGVSQMSPTD